MLTQDQVLVSNQTSLTAPGTTATMTYTMVNGGSGASGTSFRRDLTTVTAGTYNELTCSHKVSGKGFNERITSLVKFTLRKEGADLTLTSGVVPTITVNFTINRPVRSGGGITDADAKDLAGRLVHFLCTSGNVQKVLNQEV